MILSNIRRFSTNIKAQYKMADEMTEITDLVIIDRILELHRDRPMTPHGGSNLYNPTILNLEISVMIPTVETVG